MTKYDQRILHGLLKALDDENYISKLSRYKILSFLAGWVCFFISFLESLQPNIPLWAISLTGIFSGLLIGVGFFIELSIRQWPVVKAIIDIPKAKELGEQT
jgi:hypothetical protein